MSSAVEEALRQEASKTARAEVWPDAKKVLVISFDFPPRRTSGVYRIVKLVKYLCRSGWQPTVLTAEGSVDVWSGAKLEDATLLSELPAEVRVVRTRYRWVAAWEEPAGKLLRGGEARETIVDRSHLSHRVLRRLGEWLRSLLYFPDPSVGWIPYGLAKAVDLHFQNRFDAVFTTSPPRSSPVIGMLLKRLLGVPWVAEFMDPWYPPQRPLRRKFERWLQLALFHEADRLVVVTRGHAEELQRSYGVPAEKLEIIPNGFDEEDFPVAVSGTSDLLQPGYVHLSHLGTVYPQHAGRFFAALEELASEWPEVKERLRINIIGFPDESALASAKGGLRDVVQIHGFQQHQKAIQAMRGSDGLLLFLGDPEFSRLAISSKIYEYLRVGRPILAVAYEGGVQELITQGGVGWVVRPDDVQGIKQALRMLLGQNGDGIRRAPARPELVQQFRYDRLAQRLAWILTEVAKP